MEDHHEATTHAVHSEHDHLKELIEGLRSEVSTPELLKSLEEVQQFLHVHFEMEEGPDGLESVIAERAPNRVAALRRVLDEHRDLAATLDRCMVKAKAIVEGPLTDLNAEVQHLCAELMAHEHRESEILSDGLYLDVGPGD